MSLIPERFIPTIEALDETMADVGVSLTDRPWKIARILINKKIIQFEEASQGDLIKGFGFGYVLRMLQEWYESNYGEDYLKQRSRHVTGLAHLRNDLFLFELPVFVQLADDDQGNLRLKCANEVEPEEDISEYFDYSSGLRLLGQGDSPDFEAQIKNTAEKLRKIWIALIGLRGKNPAIESFSHSLLRELSSGVRHVAPFNKDGLPRFLESMRHCCEVSIKIALSQEGLEISKTHAFEKLVKGLGKDLCSIVENNVPKALYDYSKISGYRYGEEILISVKDTFLIYEETLSFLGACCTKLKRDFDVGGSILTLRKPVWNDATYKI